MRVQIQVLAPAYPTHTQSILSHEGSNYDASTVSATLELMQVLIKGGYTFAEEDADGEREV
jgi:hypothetical protein